MEFADGDFSEPTADVGLELRRWRLRSVGHMESSGRKWWLEPWSGCKVVRVCNASYASEERKSRGHGRPWPCTGILSSSAQIVWVQEGEASVSLL